MTIRSITMDELLAKFDHDTRPAIRMLATKKPAATHIALFENLQMDSSARGACTAVLVGPDNTFKTLEEIDGRHLGDMPSQRQYAVAAVALT